MCSGRRGAPASKWSERHPGIPRGLVGLLTQIEHLTSESPESVAHEHGVNGCRLKDLAATPGLDASTVSRGITHLIHRGLVERRSDPLDGRVARLAPTADGRTVLAHLHASILEDLADAVRRWDPGDVEAFAAALHHFADGLAARATGAVPVPVPFPAGRIAPDAETSLEVTR